VERVFRPVHLAQRKVHLSRQPWRQLLARVLVAFDQLPLHLSGPMSAGQREGSSGATTHEQVRNCAVLPFHRQRHVPQRRPPVGTRAHQHSLVVIGEHLHPIARHRPTACWILELDHMEPGGNVLEAIATISIGLGAPLAHPQCLRIKGYLPSGDAAFPFVSPAVTA